MILLIAIKKMFFIITLLLASFLITSCGNNQNEDQKNTGYDGKVFDISLNQDKSVTLTSKKVGNNYEIEISGQGKTISYAKKEEVPWNILVKKVSRVTINNGVLDIGDYYFYSVNLDSYFLPESITSISEHSFANGTKIYSYNSELKNDNYEIYHYSDKYVDDSNYFVLINNYPLVCKNYRFLFIGNSFTYRDGTPENPKVPYYFEQIAQTLGIKVEVDFVIKGSHTLAKFANKSDEMGSIVETKLTTNQYDFVILQEQSTTPIESYDAFNNAVKALVKRIGETQTDCQIYLYETWGSETAIKSSKYETVAEMEKALKDAYYQSASENEVGITYVGSAFTYVYDNLKDINIYADDNRHQNNYGAYLSACMHLNSMLHIDVNGANYYGELDLAKAQRLQEVSSLITYGKQ